MMLWKNGDTVFILHADCDRIFALDVSLHGFQHADLLPISSSMSLLEPHQHSTMGPVHISPSESANHRQKQTIVYRQKILDLNLPMPQPQQVGLLNVEEFVQNNNPLQLSLQVEHDHLRK